MVTNKQIAELMQKRFNKNVTYIRRAYPRGLGWRGNYLVKFEGDKETRYIKKSVRSKRGWVQGNKWDLYF